MTTPSLMNFIKQYIYLLIFAVLVSGCNSKSEDVNSSEEVNSTIVSEEVNNTIVSEKYFVQNPSRVANANQTVYLRVEHPNLPDKHMSDDIGEKGCDTINYYIDDSLTAIEIGDDMDINVTLYKDGQVIVKASKGQQAALNEEGQYMLKVCHSGYGYKNMHLPVFINKKSEAQKNPSLIYKASKLAASAQSGGSALSFDQDFSNTTIQNLDFTHTDLNGINWTGCTVQNNTFDHSSFDMKTNFLGSTFLSNTFTGVTFFPQTFHGIPSFTGNNVSNSILMAPSFVYKIDVYNVGKTDLTNTIFKNSQIYSPIFGTEVSYQIYVKPPWYDVLLHGLEDAWDAAGTAKFWENVGEAAGIGLAMAGLAILTDGVADVAAGPALADALADSTADMVEDVASDAAGDAGGDAGGELSADGEGLSNLHQYDDVNFDMMEDGDSGSDIENYDTISDVEVDMDSQWDQYDTFSEDEAPDDLDAENICKSSYATEAIALNKVAMAGIGFGVSYLKQLQSGSPTNAGFFKQDALVKSIGAIAGTISDKIWCNEYDKLNNRNLITGGETDTKNLLKQLSKNTAISLGIDAIAAYGSDVSSNISAEEEKLKEAFAGLKNANDDITAITTAFGEMLVDNNVTKYFTKIKRHYLGSEISKTATYIENNITIAVNNGSEITGPAKMQNMSQSMQMSILEQLKTGGDHSEIVSSTVAGDFINCVITTPKFGNIDGFSVMFGKMNNSMFATYSTDNLPSPFFMTELNDVSIYGGTYDLGSYTDQDGGRYGLSLTGTGTTIYNAVFNNVTSFNLNKATLVNTRINTNPFDPMFDPTSDNTIYISNSNILDNTIISIPDDGAVQQNIIVSDSNIRNSFLDLPANSSVDFSGATITKLNDCSVFLNDPYPAMDNCLGANATNGSTIQVLSSPINSATQNWSNSSLSCQDIANIGIQGNSFGTAEVFFSNATNINLEGVSFKYSDGCVLTGLVDMLHKGVITNTNNLMIDYNIYGIKDVFTYDDWIKYTDIKINFSNPGLSLYQQNFSSQLANTAYDLTNRDMSYFTFSNLYFVDTNFSNSSFSGATFTDVEFAEPVLLDVSFYSENVNFSNAYFKNVAFNSKIVNADFSNAIFENSPLNIGDTNGMTQLFSSIWTGVTGVDFCSYIGHNVFGTSLTGADLSSCDLRDVIQSGWNLIDTNLSKSLLSNTDFKDVNLTGSDLSDANLTGVSFIGAILNNVKFSAHDFSTIPLPTQKDSLKNVNWNGSTGICDVFNNNIDALGKTFIGAKLTECNVAEDFDFSGWDLHDANFTNVDVTNMNFTNANLNGVDWNNTAGACNVIKNYTNELGKAMAGANLSQCNVNNFDFSGWDLRGVNFSSDTLMDVNFTNANLQGATLSGYNATNGITLPAQKDSLLNVNWKGVDSSSLCPLICHNADALGDTMIGADLTECGSCATQQEIEDQQTECLLAAEHGETVSCTVEGKDLDLAGWNLDNGTLPKGYDGNLTCTHLSNATGYVYDSWQYAYGTVNYAEGTICGANSTYGFCQDPDGTCQ